MTISGNARILGSVRFMRFVDWSSVDYTGETRPVESWDLAPREVPVFLSGDPESEKLLFVRAAWGLESLTPSIPPLAPPLTRVARPGADAEARHRADLWSARWESLWTGVATSYDAIRGDQLLIAGFAETTPPELLTMDLPSSFSVRDVAVWRAGIPKLLPLNDRYSVAAASGDAAYGRGLSCVVVLPLAGVWWRPLRGRVLLVTPAVHDSIELLITALDEF